MLDENLLNAVTPTAKSPSKHPRLISLDVVRGLTIAVMVLVDEIGAAYPSVNHSPWNNITFADFVMPWFLFMVGTSAAFSLRKFKQDTAGRWKGTQFVALRAFKLYGLGVLLQGGGWFGDPGQYAYGYNMATIRWCGILNRIGFAYFIVGLMEIWVGEIQTDPKIYHRRHDNTSYTTCAQKNCHNSHLSIFVKHGKKWTIAFVFVFLHLILTFTTYVPSWSSKWGHNPNATKISLNGILQPPRAVLLHEPFTIACNNRGHHDTPQCSAAGYYDRLLFGQNHLGQWMSTRLAVCSTCSPGAPDSYNHTNTNTTAAGPDCEYKYDQSGPTAGPRWCFANMYDPEGALATVPTVMSAWLGTHFGRVLKHDASWNSKTIMVHWSVVSSTLIALGLLIHCTFFKMNKQLWSTSYLFFMAGTCGMCLTIVYGLIDAPAAAPSSSHRSGGGSGGPPLSSSTSVPRWSKAMKLLLSPLQYMGMNAILIFFWHGTAESVLDGAYWQTPKMGGGYEELAPQYLFGERQGWFNRVVLGWMDPEPAQLVYVLLKIGCYAVAMWYCYRVGYFWKI